MRDQTLNRDKVVILELKPWLYTSPDVVHHDGSSWLLLPATDAVPEQYVPHIHHVFVVSTEAGRVPVGYGTDEKDWFIRGRFGNRDLLIVCADTVTEAIGLTNYLRTSPRKAELSEEQFRFQRDAGVIGRLDYWRRITSLLLAEGARVGFKEVAA